MKWRTTIDKTQGNVEASFLSDYENKRLLIGAAWTSRAQVNFRAHILEDGEKGSEVIYLYKRTLNGLDYSELYKQLENLVDYKKTELEQVAMGTDIESWNHTHSSFHPKNLEITDILFEKIN